MKLQWMTMAALSALVLQGWAIEKTLTPEAAIAGFEKRVDAIFRAEAGEPLVRAEKRPPLGPGRGNYVRHYSYSIMAFAARCLYLGEMLDEANAALVENAQHYLDHPKDINDRDSFHWHAEIAMRLMDMYGSRGTHHPGRLTPETETKILRPIFEYAKQFSTPERYEYRQSKTWHVYESENHHVMSFTVSWHFARLARHHPAFRALRYNGATPGEHYAAWNDYFVVYCRERARKGMFIEMMSPGYNSTLMKGVFNFYDFGEPKVRQAAKQLLDLYLAYWAQEQIDGVAGGGKSRIYFAHGLKGYSPHGAAALAWYYFGVGDAPELSGHDISAMLSDYRPPAVIADLARDVAGRGQYVVRQRPQGLGSTSDRNPYRLRTDGGGIIRYSFCDPAFILGTPMCEARPLDDWTAISSQNRWQGAIFAGPEGGGRLVPIVRPKDDRVTFNAFWSVQHKGTLMTQKLKTHRGGMDMIIWASKNGLSAPVEKNGVFFFEAPGAFAAVRVVGTTAQWQDDLDGGPSQVLPGRVLVLKDSDAPVILEVMSKEDMPSLKDFQARVLAHQPSLDDGIVRYSTIYGDVLTLDTTQQQTPTVNEVAVKYGEGKAFESPFLNADYNSGVVTIEKGARKTVLDFNE